MQTAIYKITNKVNGKLYIGIAANPVKRWWEHKNQTKKTHTKLYNAFRKYGVDAFSFDVLHWCETREDARELENLVVDVCDTIKSGYNMCPGGGGGIAGPDNPFYGKPLPPEVCAKMREAAKKRGMNPKTIAKGQAALRLKEKDPEWIAARTKKTAIARKGYKASDETKAKQRAAWVERKKNYPQPGNKKVVCNETGEEFISISAAARYYGLSISVVSLDCIKGAPKKPRGRTVTFRYAEKD